MFVRRAGNRLIGVPLMAGSQLRLLLRINAEPERVMFPKGAPARPLEFLAK